MQIPAGVPRPQRGLARGHSAFLLNEVRAHKPVHVRLNAARGPLVLAIFIEPVRGYELYQKVGTDEEGDDEQIGDALPKDGLRMEEAQE